LGELAQAKGLTLEVALYGGAVFTVVYGYHQFFPRDEISEQNSLTIEAILEKVRSS